MDSTELEELIRDIHDRVYQQGIDAGREEVIDEELQKFAQWLWDSHYLVDEAFTIILVEQYKEEQKKTCFDCKNHFMSDCYLECYKHERINNNSICDDFKQLEEQKDES